MSRLGRINYQERNGPGFLSGAAYETDRTYSEHTAHAIDDEVGKIIEDATGAVRTILLERRPALEAIALRLMEKEVMDGAELRQFMEQHNPGPRLVPGSEALPAPVKAPSATGEVRDAAGGI